MKVLAPYGCILATMLSGAAAGATGGLVALLFFCAGSVFALLGLRLVARGAFEQSTRAVVVEVRVLRVLIMRERRATLELRRAVDETRAIARAHGVRKPCVLRDWYEDLHEVLAGEERTP